MRFSFSRQGLTPRERRLERCFEMLPGLTSWTILLGMTVLSFRQPLLAAACIIAFDLYWLFRLIYMTIFLTLSYGLLFVERRTDWSSRVEEVARLQAGAVTGTASRESPDVLARISEWRYRRRLLALASRPRDAQELPDVPAHAVHQLVIIPVAKERMDIVRPGLEGLAAQRFPTDRMVVALAVEERAPREVLQDMEALQREFGGRFQALLLVRHPDGIPGEARVKGANATYAAKRAADYFTERGVPFERVIVSCFDADTVVSPDYFTCLTYHYLISPNRTRASFQPIPVFHNNIWDAPAFARVLEVGSSFFQLIEATDPLTLVTFSSHSMSFKALVDIDYWPVDMISDDSAIFWKAYIHFDGDYRVVPMSITLSMDVAAASGWRRTAEMVYKQKRRWAWGVENFPIVMRAFLRADRIPWSARVRHALKLFSGHIAWATWAFLLTMIGWVPALFAGREFSLTVMYYSAPRITSTIFNVASLALVVTIVLSVLMLPRPRTRFALVPRIVHAFEWLMIPLVALWFSAVPALDAQTRLMFGRYMEFWVTDKTRARR